MRQLVLDTETSGLDFEKDRIIEIGCLEIINGEFSGKKFHKFYRPDNITISQEAEEIHGLNNSFLSKYPTFDQDIDNFLFFFDYSQLIIHNAQFDLSMINQSLKRLSKPLIKKKSSICTLEMAKKKYPGSKNNLNALCRRFEINLDTREKHGALTDSFLLLEVYNELLGGKQQTMKLNLNKDISERKVKQFTKEQFPIINLTEEEITKHRNLVNMLKNSSWET